MGGRIPILVLSPHRGSDPQRGRFVTKVQGLNRLTALAVQNLSEAGWHRDGGGLYLEITASGRKRWALRVTSKGKTRDFGLGPLQKVSLKDAREAAAEYRAMLFKGIDPVAEKKVSKAAPAPVLTFKECTEHVFELRKAQMRPGKHVEQWYNQIEDHAFAAIGSKPADQITAADMLAVLTPIWGTKPETARRIRQRLHKILDWARAAGHRNGDNPVDLIGEALPKQKRSKRHFNALPYAEVATFVRDLRAGRADIMTKLAFEFLILTVARTKEVRFARWDEIDEQKTSWTIPGEDEATGRAMKMGREHTVPLSGRAVAILKEARSLVPTGALIFPDAQSGRAMSENRFLIARDALGYAKRCTPHGFRSSFRDWVSEETNFPSEVAEMALAHAIRSGVEAAYRRGNLINKRRELMTAWAVYIQPA